MAKTTGSNGAAYLAIGAAVILLWSGVKGKSASSVIRSILTGKNPGNLPDANAFVVDTGTGSVPGTSPLSGTDSAVANDALQYQGVPYKWGGHLPSGWDCSGLVWYVLGHDMGITVLGMRYSDRWHGPVAASYMAVGTAVPEGSEQAGDLVVWATHIGIVTAPGRMISALDAKWGTKETPIEGWGPQFEPKVFRRLAARNKPKHPVVGSPLKPIGLGVVSK
jgi:cell wall-associated NlpC family hydrolase